MRLFCLIVLDWITSETSVAPVVESTSDVKAGLPLLSGKDPVPDKIAHPDPVVDTTVPIETVGTGLFTSVLPDVSGVDGPGAAVVSSEAPEHSLVPGTPQKIQGGVLMHGSGGGLPLSPVDFPALPMGDAMDEDTKSGQKRKPARVHTRTKKVPKSRSEGTINTLLLDRSSSDSDHTIMVSDTQSEVTVEEDRPNLEVPLTHNIALSALHGPESIAPTDKYATDKYSYESTVVGPSLFSVGDQGSNLLSTSVVSNANRIPNTRKRKGRLPKSKAPVAVPSVAAPPAPSKTDQSRVPVPPNVGTAATVRMQSRVQLKPRLESPTVIVKPVWDSLDSSLALKRLLEEKISPQQLGLRVLACLPAAGNGVLVKIETAAMATLLEKHINTHPDLISLCTARAPRRPSPRILVYDVPALPGDRGEQEALFFGEAPFI
ncbi:hypothetical protein AVEN_247558-1 [Araneus ventricosus]|uniref:Uncharacterized protein n=1 Tax=Araneus ventricosus TaxID=182803 RepID=A0A4Y2D7X0_ARAVE|nr:hypothetical protein AVEN_247558-1 [Araneus ventricosus]